MKSLALTCVRNVLMLPRERIPFPFAAAPGGGGSVRGHLMLTNFFLLIFTADKGTTSRQGQSECGSGRSLRAEEASTSDNALHEYKMLSNIYQRKLCG